MPGVDLTNKGVLPYAEFFERLRENVLGFEIQKNQQKLNVNKQKNQETKRKNLEAKADLVVSTVHGAKGLEFDNAVILYKEDSQMSQDLRRLYYVAFTRAMKSEYILAYGTGKNPPIVSNYESIVATLTEREERAAKIAAGIDPDEELDGNERS